MELIPVDVGNADTAYRARLCQQLEQGNILLLEKTPFLPSPSDGEFLRAQKQSQRAAHKNIAYKPHLQRTTGTGALEAEEAERLRVVLAAYSQGALATLGALFPNYAREWKVDYASFRPVEEQGRQLAISHRNDLLHLDAFPTRPTHGGRILRAFTNLNTDKDRIWATSDDFEDLAARYAMEAGLGKVTSPWANLNRQTMKLRHLIGLRAIDRSAYDQFMLDFHHYLKCNTDYQQSGQRNRWTFPPGSTWITFTDQVAHAVISGQYALEQTCIVPMRALMQPELAPLSVLERLAGKPLTPPASRAHLPAASA